MLPRLHAVVHRSKLSVLPDRPSALHIWEAPNGNAPAPDAEGGGGGEADEGERGEPAGEGGRGGLIRVVGPVRLGDSDLGRVGRRARQDGDHPVGASLGAGPVEPRGVDPYRRWLAR